MASLWTREETLSECSYSANFAYKADPDIAGIGIIVAFLLSAYGTVVLSLVAYVCGWLPHDVLTLADRRFWHVRSKDRPALSESVELCILVISDQQIVTGIAILAAGFTKLRSADGISIYHWQIVVYSAWMSSAVHLLTLTILRRYLQQRSVLRVWRLTAMVVLAVMLLVAQVPLFNANWDAIVSDSCHDPDAGCTQPYRSSAPSHCLFRTLLSASDLDIDTLLAFLTLVFSYIWKGTQLYGTSHAWLKACFRARPHRRLERAIRRRMSAVGGGGGDTVCHDRRFRLYLALYTSSLGFCDFCESFVSSIFLLVIQVAYGTIQIAQARGSAPDNVLEEEDKWGFGQVTAMLLLVLPVMGMFEAYSDVMRRTRSDGEVSHQSQPGLRRGAMYPRPSIHVDRADTTDSDETFPPALSHMLNSTAGGAALQPVARSSTQLVMTRSAKNLDEIFFSGSLPPDKVPSGLDAHSHRLYEALWALDTEQEPKDVSSSYHSCPRHRRLLAETGLYKLVVLAFNSLMLSLGVLFLDLAASYTPGLNWSYLLIILAIALAIIVSICLWALLPWHVTRPVESAFVRVWRRLKRLFMAVLNTRRA